jgi:hypothetical protein
MQDALWDAIQIASGIHEESVVWSMQGQPRPASVPFIVLTLGPILRVGQDQVDHNFDDDRTAGSEVEQVVSGMRECSLIVDCYDAQMTERGTANNQLTAYSLLSKVQAKLSLPSIRGGLQTAGVGIFDEGNITNTSEILGPEFEARAQLTVRFYYEESASEFTGYIGTVEITNETTDESFVAP